CVFHSLPAFPGAVRHPPVPPGDLAGTVHQPGRCQRLEGDLPLVWRARLCEPGDHPARLRVLHRDPGLGPLLPGPQLPGRAAVVALQQHVEH
ncbi:hypothetical protein F2P81_001392, partial [Scophthalmus maximus]